MLFLTIQETIPHKIISQVDIYVRIGEDHTQDNS
jgi:hypothetical protein